MSWHYSQALEAAFSEASSLDGEQSVPLKSTGTDATVSLPARTKDCSRPFRSGTTLRHSMVGHGEALLMWFLAGFPVSPIAKQLRPDVLRMISGRKCGGSWQMSLPGTYLRRTLHRRPSMPRLTTSKRWVTPSDVFPLPRQTWVQTTFGGDIGYVHTPTTKANYAATSMQKWPVCKAYVRAFGRPSPLIEEWLMAWPEGWSDTAPLATDKFQSWLQRHGACSASS